MKIKKLHFSSIVAISSHVPNLAKSLAITLFMAIVLWANMTLANAFAQANTPTWAKGRILVQPAPGVTDAKLASLLARHNANSVAKIQQIGLHLVNVPAQAEDRVTNALSHNPNIAFAEKDILLKLEASIPNDPRYTDQWHLSMIQGPVAWDNVTGSGIIVAVLDTGVDPNHSELQAKLLPGYNAVDDSATSSDINGHGTAVAGTLGAIANNNSGVASVAWDVSILPIRVTNQSNGYAYFSDIAKGLTWAADQGAKVANISYDATSSSAISSAARYMKQNGGLVVVSAGNSGSDLGYSDNPDLISVSATTNTDALASWSSFGNYIDVAAPGANILTTNLGGGIGAWNGTSFSSPVVAGVVALIMSANTQLSPAEVENILESSAKDLGNSGWDNKFGHGRINAAAAIDLALNSSSTIDDQAPTVTIQMNNNSTASGTQPVSVTANDNVGVDKVELYANGSLIGSDLVAPYAFNWDTSTNNNGNILLEAYAFDAANNMGKSQLNIIIDNPIIEDNEAPSVSILSPTNGATVSGNVKINITASDNIGVAMLSCEVDSLLIGMINDSTNYTCNWNTRKVSKGLYTITVKALDASGNSASTSISVNVGSSSKGRWK